VRSETHRRGFTLVELVVTLLVATCLIGFYIRALDEADRLALGLGSGRMLNIEQRVVIRQGLHDASLSETDSSVVVGADEATARPDEDRPGVSIAP
jgi:prepilin-type N-terminal cleavage/methylation domain-containing protein